jgi:hypothetical protein
MKYALIGLTFTSALFAVITTSPDRYFIMFAIFLVGYVIVETIEKK